ncbi:MAG: peptide/nickel transport system permease protein [Chloroflexota bacterium]|jgi:peptide/nickel transport system permease protein|nr:peptide/nickel transport system permease protein [Chloroflexota bacterium]
MGGRYLARKAAQAILTIFAIVLLNFVLFRMMPGSPERVLLRNPYLTQEKIAQVRIAWGLDKPLIPDQLIRYVEATVSGDLGYSLKFRGTPVSDVIGQRFWPTILLIGLAEAIAIVVGLAVGAYAGWRRGGRGDRIGSGISLILYSMPYFVIGMPMIVIFASGLGWFPTSGMLTVGATYGSFADQLFDFARHLTLPLATVSLGLIGGYSILMRSAIIETRSEDYVTTARAKGLTDRRVLTAHAFPNALLPMVTIIAINLGYVVGGAITAEIVFNWPGLGTLTVDALSARDYPVLEGVFLLLSVTVVLANLIADLVYGLLDPRVRS